jgi:bifunctional DNA-binding transcriptional regulator/antitoxin component of YhaV-PrlF toxin-antitoxin module
MMNAPWRSMSDMDAVQAKVTRNGQVSLPAELRRRWGAASVLVIDRGDYAIVRPMPRDPIAVLRGAHAGAGPSSEDARAADRATNEERVDRPAP